MFTKAEYERYSLVWEQEEAQKKALLKELLESAQAPGQIQVTGKKKKKKGKAKQGQGSVSTLSAIEHSEYMYLLQCYQQRVVTNPSLQEQQDIIRLAELQTRVVAEQQEFLRQWPWVPGRRPETFAKGIDSWGQRQLAELKYRWPREPWVPVDNVEKVLLLKATRVSPLFLRHVGRKAGTVVQPKPGCALLALLAPQDKFPTSHSSASDSAPITADFQTTGKSEGEDEEEGHIAEDDDGDVLAHEHKAILLVDLETLLLDWQGSPWLLPLRIADSGLVCLGTVLPSGSVRDWNERLFNSLVYKWIEDHQMMVVVPRAGAEEESVNQVTAQAAKGSAETGVEHSTEQPSKQLKELRLGQPTEQPVEPPLKRPGVQPAEKKPEQLTGRPAVLPVEHPVKEMAERPSKDIELESPASPCQDLYICSSPGSSEELVIDEGLIRSPSQSPTPVAASDNAAPEDAAGFSCPQGDVWYDLWELTPGGKRVLLRHQAWNDTNGQLCTVMVKSEYQSLLGAEALSALEQIQQMARLSLFPRLLRVRVEVQSGHVLLVEEVKSEPDHKDLRLSALFGPINALADQLHGLAPGTYLLTHEAGEAHAQLLTPGTGDGWDLHAELDRRAPQRPSATALSKAHASPWPVPPLDPEVVFPDHFQRGRVPLTFPPRQFEAGAQLAASPQEPSWSGAGASCNADTSATRSTMLLRSGNIVSPPKNPIRRGMFRGRGRPRNVPASRGAL
ncbi:uncharacterized protein LOC142573066 isoform X2 [Dermacentor variabilis]|uniref:uncharacterized protein LOC142573066 isoform X2 n=1 Tax=Dermacentor variabilis TaxID=34621 RepID=UPI003F5B69AC